MQHLTGDRTPRFTAAEAERIAAALFGIAGSAASLPSERDQNFAIAPSGTRRYVLKIARLGEDQAVLDFENAAVAHLAARVPSLSLPGFRPTVSGELVGRARDAMGREHLVRLARWLEGELFSSVPRPDARLLSSLGLALAQIDSGFAEFSHAAMHRELQWDLRLMERALTHRPLLRPELRSHVDHFRSEWLRVPWDALPCSVIHGDANDNNILVRSNRVAALIDFGDMVHSARVCELAIGIAYAMLESSDPLAVAAHITSAYNEYLPLTEAEIASVFPLAVSRLCMSVCYAAHNAIVKQDDPYQVITAGPAGSLLERLAKVPFATAQTAIRAACGRPARMRAARSRLFGGNLGLSYREPLEIVRGSMQYLYDPNGRRYLDAYNNVPHVGHCHEAVVRAGQEQMAVLNTNTRYLSELAIRYAEQLTATLPGALKVCYLVNSGSEANELAIRLARSHTGRKDVLVLDHGYHGNTNTLIDLSPYKHSGPGGQGAPAWVHVAELPDVYRGRFTRSDAGAGERYAASVVQLLQRVAATGGAIGAFIAESWPSVAGQIELPSGYLAAVYRAVREFGGVCIADEVQTGLGRLGTHFWGFQAYGVIPDVVVLGKPMGNGHPLGAVITTPEIAASFDNGMEFFSTFGGNTVSCAVGLAVLQVVREERLQEHARNVGRQLLQGLRDMAARHAVIGDVRGSGLFLGVELVRDRETREPATTATTRVINLMRDHGVLVGSEGPHHNVIKIRPPLPFDANDARELLEKLEAALRDPHLVDDASL